MDITRMSKRELEDRLEWASDEEYDDIREELRLRRQDDELMDWDEQDRRAHQEELIENLRNER